jgi:DNA-binding transcriptional LysR family regulator
MNLSGFDLNLLRVLDALLREGSTVRAGISIGLSQSAISAALGRLRTSLGDPLFVRRGQGLEPTDFAKSLEVPLRDLLEQIQGILSGPEEFDPARITQNFRISGSDFYGELLMPQLAEMLWKSAPGIRVQLIDLMPDNYLESLERKFADIVLLPRIEFPEWTDAQHVLNSSFVMIARKNHPQLSQAEITAGETVPLDLFCDLGHVLMSPEGKVKGLGDTALEKVERERRIVMTLPFFGAVYRSVAQSDLVSLIPQQLAHSVASKLGLEIYHPPVQVDAVMIFMIWHKRSSNNPVHKWMRNLIARLLLPLNEGEAPLTNN